MTNSPPDNSTIENKTPLSHLASYIITAITAKLRLTQLDLKMFNGAPSDWVSYKYDSGIHDDLNINSVIQMKYLLSTLPKEPLNLIKNVSISAANYCIAYQSLSKPWGRKQTLLKDQTM